MIGRGRVARPVPARAAEARSAAPRLDWRFLLADPELERVGVLGRRRERLLAPLRALGRSVAVLDSGPGDAEATGAFELVVACEPSAAELDLAAARVEPGGALVVETRGPLNLQTSGRVARRLAGLGFEDVRSYWHWPSFERCTRIIPLEDRAVIRYGLSRGGQGIGARIAAWLGRGMLRAGLLRWSIACATVVGRRPRQRMSLAPSTAAATRDGLGPGTSAVPAFLHQHWDRLGLDRYSPSRRLSFVVLTPQFRNSSHLVFLLLPEGGSEPVLVAKVSRLPGSSSKSEGEAQRLRAIQSCAPGGFPSIPRLVAFEALGSRTMLLETALRGRAMDRSRVRAEAPRCCEAALAWLIEVQSATRVAPGRAPGEVERLVEDELQRAEALVPHERKLLERTRQLLAPLARAGLPLVLEHRDLSHPNLLVDQQGRLAVTDWEMAELRGLPAADLFFFLAYVAIARRGARSGAEISETLERPFLGNEPWVRSYVGRYAEALGVPSAALKPLFIACWMRQVTGLAQRLGHGGAELRTVDAEVGERVRRDWRFAAWQRAVDQVDWLDWSA